MRSIWTGSISFGLVNIPVKLFSAVKEHSVGFHLIHKKDNAPVKYKKVCAKEDVEISSDEIVKGLEISKGRFQIIEKDELEKIKPEKTDYIDIIEVVDRFQLDIIYYDKHYYLGPQKEGDKAYFLFKEVLELSGKIAIARYVMKEKEYTCAISSYRNGLLLSNLNYAFNIRNIEEINELSSIPNLRGEEITLAQQLIDQLYVSELDMEKYKDTFVEEIKKILKDKEKGIPIEISPRPKEAPQDLMQALKASLGPKGNKRG